MAARQQRAETTRRRLLDATVEALVECGYAGTSTQEVCRRANVSRGTLLHHFPTREVLLVAAMDHVLHDRVAGFVAARQAEGGVKGIRDLVERMWEQWQGPALIAWLELAVAARTNPAIKEPMQQTMLQFDDAVLQAFRDLRPVGELPEPLETIAPFFTFALLNGLAVGQSYETPGRSTPVLELLITLAEGVALTGDRT